MINTIPNEGGIKAWLNGESGVASFGDGLRKLGSGLKGFANETAGIESTNIVAVSNAAKSLAQTASSAPKNTSKLGPFGDNLAKFGNKLREYFSNIANITEGAIAISNKAVKALKSLDSINGVKLKIASIGINDAIKAIKNMSGVKSNSADGFTKAVNAITKVNINSSLKTITSSAGKMKNAGSNLMSGITQGMKSEQSAVSSAGKEIMDKLNGSIKSNSGKIRSSMALILKMVSSSIRSYYSNFYNAGSYLSIGFAKGISSGSWYANLKARALANAAARAAAAELKEHSPSRVGHKIGAFFGLGFVNGIGEYVKTAYEASSEIATSAKKGLTKAVNYTKDLMRGALDSQPTIRPVMDLSNVKSAFGEIDGMFANGPSVGVSANIDAISSMMNHKNQNRVGNDIVSAINKLRKDLSNVGNTSYVIEGITYDDGSNISDAVKTLTRAVKVERRI